MDSETQPAPPAMCPGERAGGRIWRAGCGFKVLNVHGDDPDGWLHTLGQVYPLGTPMTWVRKRYMPNIIVEEHVCLHVEVQAALCIPLQS